MGNLDDVGFTGHSLLVVFFLCVLLQTMRLICSRPQRGVKKDTLVEERLQLNTKASFLKWERSSSPGNGGRRSQARSSPKPLSVCSLHDPFFLFLFFLLMFTFEQCLASFVHMDFPFSALERKISVRKSRDELIARGVLKDVPEHSRWISVFS